MTSNRYIAFHKPYGVVCQFSGEGDTLSDFDLPAQIYAAGRLDKDSEGLLILTNDGPFIQRLTDPKSNKQKIYWVQVEGLPTEEALGQLRSGVLIKGKKTRQCEASLLDSIKINELVGERNPPVRFRKNKPTYWIEVTLREGMNRQVRRSCAAIGFPCLRLIRVQIGKLKLGMLKPGKWLEVNPDDVL